MRSRRPSPEHQEAVSRRLALLSAELAEFREDSATPGVAPAADGTEWWAPHTHVPDQPRRLAPVPDEVDGPEDYGAVPVPGRHASRRGRVSLAASEAIPETLRGRVALGPSQITVVALLIAVGLAVTTWWVVRSDPSPSAPIALTSAAPMVEDSLEAGAAVSAPPAGEALEVSLSPQAAAAKVTVDVAGKVRKPGVVSLPSGSRVIDALKAAGGPLPHVVLTSLNLARVLVDGEQVLVGVPGGEAPAGGSPAVAGSSGSVPAAGTPVDLNTATMEQLDALPEVGPVTAQSILDWREENGRFTSVQELLEVDGIGEVTLDKLAPYVTV